MNTLTLGTTKEGGKVVFRDLFFTRNNQKYIVSIATPQYIENTKIDNLSQPDQVKFDTNIYPFDNVADELLVDQFLQDVSFETIQSYVTPVDE